MDKWNVAGQRVRICNYCEVVYRQINNSTSKKPDISALLEIMEEVFEEEKMKFRHNLKHGRKTTPCINNILQLLLRKLFHNMIGYLVCLDAVGHAVHSRKMSKYEVLIGNYLMRNNFHSL